MSSRRAAWGFRFGAGALALLLGSCQRLSIPRTLPSAGASATPITPAPAQNAAAMPWPLVPTLPTIEGGQEAALLPAFAGDAALFPNATHYTIEASVTFDPATHNAQIEGRTRIRYTVPPGDNTDTVPLMLWPNDAQYYSRMRAGPALIDGTEIEPKPGSEDIYQVYRLPEPADGGEVLDIDVPFEVDVGGPADVAGLLRFGIRDGVLSAPTFYPLIPRRVNGTWKVDAAPPGGDTTNSDTAFYRVALTVPLDLELAATGVEMGWASDTDGTQTVRFVSGPVRDFAFALGPFERMERTADGVRIRAWFLPEHSREAGDMLDAAGDQLALLNDWVGPYPYAELDLVDAPGRYGGIEYPGLIYMGVLGSARLTDVTVHEVGHQWFYALVGNDQLNQPWLDEALANYTIVLYYEDQRPPGTAEGVLSYFWERVWQAPDPTLPIGDAVGAYGSEAEYSAIVYSKGALFLDALRGEMGDETFRRFLRDYFADFRYGFASAEDFQETAEEACDCDLDPLFDLWVWRGGEVPGN